MRKSNVSWLRAFVISAFLSGGIFAATYGYAAIYSHELTIKIVNADVPEVCHKGLSLLHPQRFRSSIPRQDWDFCGVVLAENGIYHLPTSSEILSPHDRREDILGQLRDGCEYHVKIVGGGAPFSASEGITNRNTHVISHILEELPC